jgi:catechol 2,3-dioxygenase-like lactoylglutathione lyase family enzyme
MKASLLALAGTLAVGVVFGVTVASTAPAAEKKTMDLGNFSVSLAVKDIKASKAFYEKLDFVQVSGQLEQNWVVLQSGNARIGRFQGMVVEANEATEGPAYFQVTDPDGNVLLFDQHVQSPKR